MPDTALNVGFWPIVPCHSHAAISYARRATTIIRATLMRNLVFTAVVHGAAAIGATRPIAAVGLARLFASAHVLHLKYLGYLKYARAAPQASESPLWAKFASDDDI